MPARPIRYFNRYKGRAEVESVYGEPFLRWIYESAPGRSALHLFIKRSIFSTWYGWRMSRADSRTLIAPFVRQYAVDTSEMEDGLESFASFNAFFSRKLKPASRPIDPSDDTIVFPADGRHLGFPNLAEAQAVFVKGQRFDLDLLLMNAKLANHYRNGTLILSRLCPVDYHRFHFPVAGVPGRPRLINGLLYSVSPIALRQNLDYLWSNKRVLTRLETDHFGTVLLLEIGATCVGSIQQSFEPNWPAAKGQEKGWFEFGGSSTITLFEPGRVQLASDLVANTRQQLELYARMGDVMGSAI